LVFPPEEAKIAPSLGAKTFRSTRLQENHDDDRAVEFRERLLSVRDEILQSLGHPVISALALRAARNLDLSGESVGVVLIGHGAPWDERCELAAHFRRTLPGVPIVASGSGE
jgi:hypothetical protein